MSSQPVSITSSGVPAPNQPGPGSASTPAPAPISTPAQGPAPSLPAAVNSGGEAKPPSSPAKTPVKATNPKVVVQPVNPPLSIALPVAARQSMFITQHKHSAEPAKMGTSVALTSTPSVKPSQTLARPVVSKLVTTTVPQATNYVVSGTPTTLAVHQVSLAAQPVPTTHPVAHVVQTAAVGPSLTGTHVLSTAPTPGTQLFSSTQVRLPVATSGAADPHKVKVGGVGLAQATVAATGPQPTVASAGPAGHTVQQYVRGLSVHPAMITGTHVAAGQVQHSFPSHLPRGAVAAAAMSAPKSGMTTAILRTTTPVSQQFPSVTTMMASSATIQSPIVASQQLQRHHPPTQVHLPAQHHLPSRLHAPTGLATVGLSPTGLASITRASSPGTAAVSQPQHHPIPPTEPHRTLPHVSLPQGHVQATGHPFRPDIKQLPKVDKKPSDPKSVDPKPADAPKGQGEVKLGEQRVNFGWTGQPGGPKQQQQQLPPPPQQQQQLGVAKHTYIASGLGVARLPHPSAPGGALAVTSPVPASQAAGHVSSSLVTATTLSHHTVPSQSIIHSSVRTSAITVTTLSTQPQSVTTTSIPVAKVYPRQQPPPAHTVRPSGSFVSEAPYVSAHSRNSPTAPAVATATASLPAAVTVGDGRGERPPHPGVMPHGYPASMPAYYFDTMTYRHPMMHSYGTPHSFASMSAAGVRSTLAESHIRHPLHPGSVGGPQNSSVAAAVVAAAHAATVGGPVRVNPVGMIDSRRQAPIHNTITLPASVDGSVHVSTAPSLSTAQPATGSPNPNASPRPSILKRRINNDSAVIRKLIPTTQAGSRPTSPSPKTEQTTSTSSSPKHSDSLASSQQSLDSVASEGSLEVSLAPAGLKVKQELQEVAHTDPVLARESSLTNSVTDCSPSPRKKPRKQQHKVATEHHDILDDQSTDEETETKHKHFRLKKEKKDKKPAVSDLDHLNVVHYFRRPCLRLIDTYRQSWKPTHNHFERYSDVRPKDEKKTSIHEIANQRGIVKKTDGWKVRHITYQFEDLSGLEMDVCNEMKEIKEGMTPWQIPGKESDTAKIYELIQGNIQRSQYVMEHLEEAKGTMQKLLEHKPKVMGIIKNHANKRHAKKKHSP